MPSADPPLPQTTPAVDPPVIIPPHRFSITTASCTVIQLRAMCTALGLDDSGNHTILKRKIMEAIKDGGISQVDLYQMSQMKPAFTRKPSKKNIARAKTGASVAATTADKDIQMTDQNGTIDTPNIPPPLEKISSSNNQMRTTDDFADLDPNATSLQALTIAFNESQKRQRMVDSTISKVVDRQNEVIEAVNDLGNAVHPLLKDTAVLKQTMKLVKTAMQDFTTERDNDREIMDTMVADCEQATTDLLQMFNDSTKANDLRNREQETLVEDMQARLAENVELAKTLEVKTEWLDKGQRSHNMIIFGWEPLTDPHPSSPLEDAKRYFAKIGFSLGKLFLAHRGPKTLRDGIVRPGILKVTFNSIPTCYRALEASRAHCKSNQEATYFAKADKTREQERLKRIADDGVRLLRDRHPGRDFRERSGWIAEFAVNMSGRSSFIGWIPIPTEQEDTMVE